MKSEASSISGVGPPRLDSPPHIFLFLDIPCTDGILLWRAPKLMHGSSHLTKEMDTYSFSITCIDILNWGALPWAYINDFTICHLVLGIGP